LLFYEIFGKKLDFDQLQTIHIHAHYFTYDGIKYFWYTKNTWWIFPLLHKYVQYNLAGYCPVFKGNEIIVEKRYQRQDCKSVLSILYAIISCNYYWMYRFESYLWKIKKF